MTVVEAPIRDRDGAGSGKVPELLSPMKAAEVLEVSHTTIRTLTREGKLRPSAIVDGRRPVYSREYLMRRKAALDRARSRRRRG
jgi:DNA-binding transcriptional MerR regulator